MIAIRCPTCKKTLEPAAHSGEPPVEGGKSPFPFCSARCKTIDLGAWLTERYVVAEVAGDVDSGEGEAARSYRTNVNDEGWDS